MPNPSKFDEKLVKNVGIVPDHSWDGFFMNFGGNFAPSWDPNWSQNQYKRGLEK